MTGVGEDAFKDWGWRVPYLLSGLFLAVGLWLRLKLHESPVFQKMKAEGTSSKAPLTEAFGTWGNLKVVFVAFFGAIAGQAVGAWLLQHGGRALPFGMDALGHLASAWCIWRLRTPLAAAPADPAAGPRSLRAEMAVGLRWLWQQPLVRRIAGLTCLSNFVMAAVPLLVIVLAKAQGATEAQIGLVFSASGAGGLLGALAGGWFARRFSFGQVIVGTLVVQAAMLPLLAWAPGPLTLGMAFAVLMFCGPVYNVVQLSRRLAMIPDGLQGRVNSAFRFAANVLYPVGAALCGVLAEQVGPQPTALAFATVMAALALAAASSRVVRLEGLAATPR